MISTAIATRALRDSLAKLSPRVQLRNPVMFVVYVGSILTTLIGIASLGGMATSEEGAGFVLAVSAWLWLTVLFANFAEALAEGRGKAQAAALRSMRQHVLAKQVTGHDRRLYKTVEAGTPVEEAAKLFPLEELLDGPGIVDYVVGAAPGPGVFVLGTHDHPRQRHYLELYKLGEGPLYCFTRPYHLCHLETPGAIADLCLRGKKVLEPAFGKPMEVVAFAKRDLRKGTRITHGIGSDDLYGMIERRALIRGARAVPVALLDSEQQRPFTVVRSVRQDELVTLDDLEIPDGPLKRLCDRQEAMLAPDTGAVVVARA